MASLTPAKIAEYRNRRLKEVAPATLVRELAYFSNIVNHGRREWGMHASNPVALARMPTQPKGRKRVLSLAVRERLLAELRPTGRSAALTCIKDLQSNMDKNSCGLGEPGS